MRGSSNQLAVVTRAPTVTLILPVEVAQAVRDFCCDKNIGMTPLWDSFYHPLYTVLNDHEEALKAERRAARAENNSHCAGDCSLCGNC